MLPLCLDECSCLIDSFDRVSASAPLTKVAKIGSSLEVRHIPMSSSIKTIFIDANNLRFEALTCGDGPNLALCLHGFPEHAGSWRHQMPLFAGLGYRVVAPNLRGYGHSSRPVGVVHYTLDKLIADIAGMIDALSARKVILIGHDWGGALAWEFAIQKVRPLDRLIILNAPHPAIFAKQFRKGSQQYRSWYMAFFQIPFMADWLLRTGNAWMIGQIFRRTTTDQAAFPDEVIDTYRKNAVMPGAMTAMINYYRAAWQRPDGAPGISAHNPNLIEIPSLVIWGEKDPVLGVSLLEGLEDYISQLTIKRLPHASHWVQQEAPEEVNAIIASWLDDRMPH